MNFEYGVQTNNRYNFFLDQEDVDPMDLIAQVGVTTEKSKEKDSKSAKGKAPTSANKSKPLQQSDNAVKSKADDSGKAFGCYAWTSCLWTWGC
jgi:hypothetical protein